MPRSLRRAVLSVLSAGLVLATTAGCDREVRAASEPAPIRHRAEPDASSGEADSPRVDPGAEPASFDDASIDWESSPVMKTLGAISETLQDASYSSGVQVDVKRGIYHFDCSGMVQWVLRKAAPRAARSAAFGLDHRPLARDFQRRIARSSIDSSPNGWRRIERMRDVKPGDVIAWIKPKVIRSPNTGHVLFVALPPKLAPGYDNAYLVRVIDSTRLLHDHDTRVGRSGFGLGTILIVTNPVTDAPVAYGWVGLRYRTFGTQIAIGRAER